jgi:hypothetical protein
VQVPATDIQSRDIGANLHAGKVDQGARVANDVSGDRTAEADVSAVAVVSNVMWPPTPRAQMPPPG